ncbi:hypothetical protein [Streptomyces sp. XH2]|uniref:hypothetical protein n=1 Tax=Streptomyces sp. XH2 TaxID=3412483 RepID=UPI003C7D44B9
MPTPRARELREEVRTLLRGCDNILWSGAAFDPVHLQRTFTVQATELLLSGLAGIFTDRIHSEAPHVDVVFRPETIEGGPTLRQGRVDVELGVPGHPWFRDHLAASVPAPSRTVDGAPQASGERAVPARGSHVRQAP